MTTLRSAFNVVTAQQDFLWFCVLLAWVAAGSLVFLHWNHPRFRSTRYWLQLVCCSGSLLAAGELVLHSWPQKIYFVETPEWDLILSALQTAQAFAAILLLGGGAGATLAAANRSVS